MGIFFRVNSMFLMYLKYAALCMGRNVYAPKNPPAMLQRMEKVEFSNIPKLFCDTHKNGSRHKVWTLKFLQVNRKLYSFMLLQQYNSAEKLIACAKMG